MHEVLLIHYDNTPLLEAFSDSIKFNPSTDDLNDNDIDTFISKQIIPQLQERSFDILCIKDTLSENYIDFYGLILAYHVRLSRDLLKEKSLVPIIILSDINELMINKLSYYGRILFTKNTFLCKNNIESVEQLLALDLEPLEEDKYKDSFIHLIHIDPPQDYLSHHSITNEWAIDQWGRMLDIDSQPIKKNRDRIASLLYYKYLYSKIDLKDKKPLEIKQKPGDGRLLLIDDKWQEGWHDIMQKFVERQFSDVKLDTFQNIDKYSQLDKLRVDIRKRVDSVDVPDVVLLDLRLLDNENTSSEHDNQKIDINKISGIVVLDLIKKINPGIQIIMFTASGDSLIIDAIKEKGILGYVKKDGPQDRYQASKNNINKLRTLIQQGLNRSYLIKMWNLQEKTLELSFFKKPHNYIDVIHELEQNIKTIFESANSNIPRPFTYSMLAIYKCFEILNSIFIIDDFKAAKWKDNQKPIEQSDDNSTKNYIFNIIKYKTNLKTIEFEDKLKELVCSRNYAIHTHVKPHCTEITRKEPGSEHISEDFEKYILNWYEMLFEILNSINKKSILK